MSNLQPAIQHVQFWAERWPCNCSGGQIAGKLKQFQGGETNYASEFENSVNQSSTFVLELHGADLTVF